jgi:hypothetical protein
MGDVLISKVILTGKNQNPKRVEENEISIAIVLKA